MAADKQTKQLAKQLFKLSLVNGQVSAEQVSGVLGWIEKNQPTHTLTLLKNYRRMIATEVAKSSAVVEHAGPLAASVLPQIESAMAKKYQRPVVATAQLNSGLLGGLRVRIGSDVYESSISSQLASLSV